MKVCRKGKGGGPRNQVQGSWLAQVDGDQDVRLAKKGIGIPHAIATVRRGEIPLPLCNARAEGTPKQENKSGEGKIRLRPLVMKYRRTYFEGEEDVENRRVILKLDQLGNIITEEMEKDVMDGGSNSTAATSELPVITIGETIKEFQRRPDTKRAERNPETGSNEGTGTGIG